MPARSRTGRAARNLSVQFAVTGLGMAVAVVTTPLLLAALGEERFGAYRIAVEYTAYLAFLDLGLGGALTARFARAAGDPAATAGLVRAGRAAYLRLAVPAAVGVLALAAAAPYLMNTPDGPAGADLAADLRAGFLAAGVGLLALPLAVRRPLADANQRGDWTQVTLAAQAVVAAVLSVALARLTGSVAGPMLGVGVGVVAGAALLARLTRSLAAAPPAPTDPVRVGGPDARRMLAFNVLTQLTVYSDLIILGQLLDPRAAAVYYVSQRLQLLAHVQVLGLGGSAWAGLTDLHFRGESALFARRLADLTALSTAFACGLLVPAAAVTPGFVRLWVGADQFAGAGVTALTAAWTILSCPVTVWAWPVLMSGRVGRLLPVMAAAGAVNVAVKLAATDALGPAGTALGTVAGYAGVSVWWLPWVLKREFGVAPGALYLAALRPAVLAAPFAAGAAAVAVEVDLADLGLPRAGQWAVLVAAGGVASLAYLLAAWRLAVPPDLRRELAARFRPRRIAT